MINIIIPSHNQAQYLREALDSCQNQTVSCFITIIDDGSTDNSLEVAKEYAKETNVQIISQVNKGLSSARNTGIMNTRDDDDDYLLFLDADDILLPNCVERIEQEIEKTHADIIAPSFKCFGKAQDTVILMPNPTIEDFKTANRIGYCQAIKREALLGVGGYNPKMVWGAEDLDLTFDLLKRGKKLVTIPEVLWLYRVKENSMWTETAKHQAEFMNQIKLNHPEIKW